MSTHNICFYREIRNILCGYSLLSVAMYNICLTALASPILIIKFEYVRLTTRRHVRNVVIE